MKDWPWNHRNFYGRIKGKALNAAQERYLQEDLPSLALPGSPARIIPSGACSTCSRSRQASHLWLEIGFGGGEHLVHQALANPEVQFLGVEPYVNGVAMLLGKMRKAGVENIKLHMGDARDLDGCFTRRKREQGLFALSRPLAKTAPPSSALCHARASRAFEPLPDGGR